MRSSWQPAGQRVVNLTAVAKQYGAAHRAFTVVPLCGFFIDVVNALIINFLVGI